MAFRLEDFKKTSRKSAEGGRVPPLVYPHQMRDKKAQARLDAAIGTFDAQVGKRRGEMDATMMTDLFGDPRLARGVIACLGRFYRYKTPAFAEIVNHDAAQRLNAAGLTQPMALRALTYARVNAAYDGFLSEADRAGCYAALGQPFGIAPMEWDTLLYLDAEDNQVLTRPGPMPTSGELATLYNFHSLETPLRRAVRIVLHGLRLSTMEAADVRALARHLGAKVVVSDGGGTVTLAPLETASLLTHRPGRLGRCLLHLLQAFGSRDLTGWVDAKLGARTFRLTLTPETLTTLGMRCVTPDSAQLVLGEVTSATASLARVTFRRRFEAAVLLHQDLLKRRAQGLGGGWRITRLPEPTVTSGGVLLPDLTLQRDSLTLPLLLGDTATEGTNATALVVPLRRKSVDAAAILAQAEAWASKATAALPAQPLRALPPALRALCDRAAQSGMVPVADAQRALHLLDESPLIEWVRHAADPRVRYVPGIGLCSQELVAAIGALSSPQG